MPRIDAEPFWIDANDGVTLFVDDGSTVSLSYARSSGAFALVAAGTSLTLGRSCWAVSTGAFSKITVASSPSTPATGEGRAHIDVTAHGAQGDGVTDDTAAVVEAFAAATSGEVVYFPTGTYKIAVGALSTSVAALTLMGDGLASSVIQFTGAVPAGGDVHGVQTTAVGGLLTLSGLKLIAPPITNSSSNCTGVFHRSQSTGRVVVTDCHIVGFQYQIRTWDGSSTMVSVGGSRSIIEGMGGAMTYPSMGIHMPGGAGSQLRGENVEFLNTGLASDMIHNHCLYLFWPVSYDLSNCTFDHVKGRFLQSFDMPVAAGHGADRPVYARITDCRFGSDIPTTTEGIITNKYLATKITGCTFLHPGKGLQLEGDTTFTACDFSNAVATAFYAAASWTGTGLAATFDGCWFSTAQEFGLRVDQANTRVSMTGCHFDGTASFWVSMEDGAAGSAVKATDCFVTGGTALGTEANACFAQIADVVTFESTGVSYSHPNNMVRSSVTTGTVRLRDNNMAMTGAAFKGSTPATIKAADNYGAKAWVTRASGVSSVADGATIAHGLSAAPTKVLLSPSVAANIAAATAKSATTITVGHKVAATGAAATASSVTWVAEV